jgi:uncharacterized protein YdhG (YjbR/CyaY superfamily)
VDAYLAEVPADRREVLAALRGACLDSLTGFEEGMGYGMPTYSRDGQGEVAWASQRRYISLYVTRSDVLANYRERLAHLDVGKGCIRYPSPAKVDLALVQQMLTEVAATRGPVC